MSSAKVHFECIMCGACCKNRDLIVTLTGRDMTKIALNLGLNAEEMMRAVDFYVQNENDEFPEGLKHIPKVITEQGNAIIALKKNIEGDCIFLKEDLCMIHEIRPGACASFPFVFRRDEDGVNWGLSAMKEICPGIGTGPTVKDSDLFEIASTILEELEIFREFANEWNNSNIKHTADSLLSTLLSDVRFIV